MPRPRRNQYPENPHPPGTLFAAQWDVRESADRLGGVVVTEAKRTFDCAVRLLRRAK